MTNNQINTAMTAAAAVLETEQAAYLAANSRYGQRHGGVSEVGVGMATTMNGASVRVNAYDGPQGKGYEIRIVNGGEERTWNVGPETFRNTGWQTVASGL